MLLVNRNTLYFLIVFMLALVSSYFMISNWVFRSDFLSYKTFADLLSRQSTISELLNGYLSIRPTEPVFIVIYWLFGKYSYILLPSVNFLVYNYLLIKYVRVSWFAFLALILLHLTPTFQAFHLQRQFMSVVFLVLSLYFSSGRQRLIFWVLAILTHNSALLMFPLYLGTYISALLILPFLYLLKSLPSIGIHVGGDYKLGTVYYIVLILFTISVIIRRNICGNFSIPQVILVLSLLCCLLLMSPYLGSRFYFTVFFVVIVPSYMFRRINQNGGS